MAINGCRHVLSLRGAEGFLTDFALERLPWSFALEDIALGEKVTIWVGEKDCWVANNGYRHGTSCIMSICI